MLVLIIVVVCGQSICRPESKSGASPSACPIGRSKGVGELSPLPLARSCEPNQLGGQSKVKPESGEQKRPADQWEIHFSRQRYLSPCGLLDSLALRVACRARPEKGRKCGASGRARGNCNQRQRVQPADSPANWRRARQTEEQTDRKAPPTTC